MDLDVTLAQLRELLARDDGQNWIEEIREQFDLLDQGLCNKAVRPVDWAWSRFPEGRS